MSLTTMTRSWSPYRKGVAKGMLKVMAKMGISTLQSYKGAQIFEAVGLGEQVIDRCFVGTSSRIQGVDFEVLAAEAMRRHELGLSKTGWCARLPTLPNDGQFHWRSGGRAARVEPHRHCPICRMAARSRPARPTTTSLPAWPTSEARHLCTLRGLLDFKPPANAVRFDMEAGRARPVEVVKRFCTGAMSFGSISAGAHEVAGHCHEPHGRQEQHRRRR